MALTAVDIPAAKKLLAAHGHTVLRTASYLHAQTRQRIAEARMDDAREETVHAREWGERLAAENRELRERITFLYGAARAHGASDAELAGAHLPARSSAVAPGILPSVEAVEALGVEQIGAVYRIMAGLECTKEHADMVAVLERASGYRADSASTAASDITRAAAKAADRYPDARHNLPRAALQAQLAIENVPLLTPKQFEHLTAAWRAAFAVSASELLAAR